MVNGALHRLAGLGWCLLAAACLLAIAAAPARAAAPLMIWPVDPVIAGSQRAVALWIENRGLQPVTVQVRVMGWTQDQGDDQFASQKDVIASPPITDIAPGARQMVRLMAMGPAAPLSEDAYRVIVDELPRPPDTQHGSDAPQAALGVQLQVRYAIPLFIYGTGAIGPRMSAAAMAAVGSEPTRMLEPDVSWRINSQGEVHRLVLRNDGPAHGRITAVGWQAADAATEISVNPGLLGYVLAGSERQWDLPTAPSGNFLLKAAVNGRAAILRRAAQ
ncbi:MULTISPECIES: molecular chaperone [unclassified Acidovorax]|uniref:fimbrial biogenesis chaperone n=1 Tax=unclassified Acidovorax TaxID=2684926 RepID=UPI0028831B4D|nr:MULTISPECIES: molecular chaperone [unclassified Acidovorax]